MEIYNEAGFDELEQMLKDYADEVSPEKLGQVLKTGADDFISDVRALPKPRSRVTSPRHTHMLDTMDSKEENGRILIGWGVYYGPILEHGSKKMQPHMHLHPTWEGNKEKYYKTMTDKLWR